MSWIVATYSTNGFEIECTDREPTDSRRVYRDDELEVAPLDADGPRVVHTGVCMNNTLLPTRARFLVRATDSTRVIELLESRMMTLLRASELTDAGRQLLTMPLQARAASAVTLARPVHGGGRRRACESYALGADYKFAPSTLATGVPTGYVDPRLAGGELRTR